MSECCFNDDETAGWKGMQRTNVTLLFCIVVEHIER